MEMKVPRSSRHPVGFLDVPLELRHMIYRHCLVRKYPIELHEISIYKQKYNKSSICDDKMSLLLVSKQVGCEALDVLYGDNVFQEVLHGNGGHGAHCILKHLSEAKRIRIRKIQMVLKPVGYFHRNLLDSTLWFPIFARLIKLSIVAQQPLQAQKYRWPKSLEEDVQWWITWVRTVLQYIYPQLSNSCIIEVDDDDRKETSALMRECLPTGYREVHTLEGDLYFGRSDISQGPVIENDYNNVESNTA